VRQLLKISFYSLFDINISQINGTKVFNCWYFHFTNGSTVESSVGFYFWIWLLYFVTMD